jgi:hypothetical protein
MSIDTEIDPLTDEEKVVINGSAKLFWHFLLKFYPLSFAEEKYFMANKRWSPFRLSAMHQAWAGAAQQYSRLCVLAPRGHLKSTILGRGFLFWLGMRKTEDFDAVYFSYKDNLARDHTTALKSYILNNPYCRWWVDNKPTSDSLVDFTASWGPPGNETWHYVVEPAGILGASRGRHPKAVVCDDILSDFANPMESEEVVRINNIFHQVVMSMPELHQSLLLVGTPQAENDVLHSVQKDRRWQWRRYPAIKNEVTQETQWPEKYDYNRLMELLAEVKPRAFQVEYLLKPVVTADAYFPRFAIDNIVDENLKRWTTDEPWPGRGRYATYGGMDVGKEVHPSHITIHAMMPDGTLMQIFEEWLSHMDFRAQAIRVNQIIEHFDVARFFYDSTRAELDDRALSKRAQGKKFKKGIKVTMATMFEKRVYSQPGEPGLILLGPENSRQVRQICAVKKDLSAYESEDGHGDSFWSNSLAIYAADTGPSFVDLGDVNDMFSRRLR